MCASSGSPLVQRETPGSSMSRISFFSDSETLMLDSKSQLKDRWPDACSENWQLAHLCKSCVILGRNMVLSYGEDVRPPAKPMEILGELGWSYCSYFTIRGKMI